MKEVVKAGMQFIYYIIIYNIFKLLPVNGKKIIFEAYHGKSIGCNPKAIFECMCKERPDMDFVWSVMDDSSSVKDYIDKYPNTISTRRKTIKFLYHFATAKYWVTNTNMYHKLTPRKSTVYLETWHAAGAFKKFGLDIVQSMETEKKLWKKDAERWTYLVCSSENVKDIYADAFGISNRKVYPLGIARNDIFFDLNYVSSVKDKFYNKFNLDISKKIILYAPTFRDHQKDVFNLHMDLEKLKKELSKDYYMILRLHPNITKAVEITEGLRDFLIDTSEYKDIQELLMVADVLITDYSSVVFDFALLGRPIVLYAYDLDYYENELRGFYFKYRDFVPGPIVYNDSELIKTVKDYKVLYEENYPKVYEFGRDFNDNFDGKASQRTVELLLRNNTDK